MKGDGKGAAPSDEGEEETSSEEEMINLEEEGDWWMQEGGSQNNKKTKRRKKKKRQAAIKKEEGSKDKKEEEDEEEDSDSEEESGSKEEEKFGGWLLELILSMVEPGVSAEALKILNWVFVALFGCLLIMIIVGGQARLHAFVLLFLSSGLFLSLQWYLSARADGVSPAATTNEGQNEAKDGDEKKIQ